MSNTTEDVNFAQGGDTGEDENLSVQPVGYTGSSEAASRLVINRIIENLRRRTEVLRDELSDLKFRSNYDNGLNVSMTGTAQLVTAVGGYRLVMSGNLLVSPVLAPGYHSGGRALGAALFIGGQNYAGTLGVNDISIVASSAATGQRGYADGESMAVASVLSVGGNNVTVELVGENRAGGAGSIATTVTGTPRRHIKITYGTQAPGVTVTQLINAINSDSTLFGTEGSFGLRHMIYATTTSPGISTSLPDFPRTKLQGGYDSEMHQVTAAQMAAFFAISDNILADGEGLAIGFPAGLVEPGLLGGRRQSLTDAPTDRLGGNAPNVGDLATYGNLFNTARQPELVPNAVPIGRVIGNNFYFLDGTVLHVDDPALSIGECYVTVARIAALNTTLTAALAAHVAALASTGGAAMVGYAGSNPYNADAAGSTNPSLAAGDLETAIDQLVLDLANQTASQSGARRLGVETLSGVPSTDNGSIPTIPPGSLRLALQALLGNDTYTNGIVRRVHENGHTMRGANPLRKNFGGSGMPAFGARFLQIERHAPVDLLAISPAGIAEYDDLALQPIVYVNPADAANDYLNVDEQGALFSAFRLGFFGMTATRFANIAAKIPIVLDAFAGQRIPLVLASITGISGAVDAPDGLYFVVGQSTVDQTFTFKKLDWTDPDFTGLSGTANVTFYNTFIRGNDRRNTLLKLFHMNAENTNPVGVIGAMGAGQRLFEIYTPSGSNGALKMRVYPDRIEFDNAAKTTNDLLASGDKVLLDGVETGVVADASANHHHAALYSKTVFRSAAHNYAPVANMSTGPWFFETPSDAPANYGKTAVILNFSCQVATLGGVAATDTVGLVLEFAGSTDFATYFAAAEGNLMTYAAVGGPVLFLQGQVTVPIYFDPLINFPTGASGFRVRIQGFSVGSGVDLTLSTLQIDEVGYVLVRF